MLILTVESESRVTDINQSMIKFVVHHLYVVIPQSRYVVMVQKN